MIVTVLTIAASALMIISYAVYYYDIKNSNIQPNRFSWVIWSFAVSLETITYNFISQDLFKSICFYISAMSCIAITIKIWATSNWTKPNWTEKISLIFCLLSLFIWAVFNSAWFAHLLLLLAIPIAFLPTYASAFKNYENENSYAWVLWSISDLLVLLIIFLRLQTLRELPYASVEFVCHISVFIIVSIKRQKSKVGYIISENHLGKAVYSTKEYKQDEIILKFGGAIINKNLLPKDLNGNKDHYMQIDFELYLGPSGKADDYVNHSCNPNAGLVYLNNSIYLKAISNIERGVEIKWDYSTTTFQTDWRMNCKCLERDCRKIITEFASLDKTLQEKYITMNIVAPYIRSKYIQDNYSQ